MQCEEWTDANSELFKEAHDEAVHKNSYKRKLYELISASLNTSRREGFMDTPFGRESGRRMATEPSCFREYNFFHCPLSAANTPLLYNLPRSGAPLLQSEIQ